MRVMPLAEAVERFIEPKLFLHFGSTPSRSNAAIVELVRRFRRTRPRFTLAATGFHSTAHLLGAFRLGQRYLACFYGDNYPQPRPHPLYQTLIDEGAELEHWSLWSYVSALRAGALGQPGVLGPSLLDTSLGRDLSRHGRYRELTEPSAGLLLPLTADVSFLHAPVADERGHAWFGPPYSEGFCGALGARRGVIITVDRLLPSREVTARPELIQLPPHRVLAICPAPFGAHPQPVHCVARDASSGPLSYRDDFAHYRLWRELVRDPALLADFETRVLDADDAWGAYLEYVGRPHLEHLRCSAWVPDVHTTVPLPLPSLRQVTAEPAASSPTLELEQLAPGERIIVFAARRLARSVRAQGRRSVLAGIGQSFAAARLCKRLLDVDGADVELMVETGFTGFGASGMGAEGTAMGDSYLLSQRNIAASSRLSSIDHVLGTLVCGAQNQCVGVIGCAQVDERGDVNSTFADGRLLVGSGGACDIAHGAREVVVLAPVERLVQEVEYVTSPGRAVSSIVTEMGVLERDGDGWWLNEALSGAAQALSVRGWSRLMLRRASAPAPLTEQESRFVVALRTEAEAVPGMPRVRDRETVEEGNARCPT